MSHSYQNLITEARELTSDSLAPFRNVDSFYINHLNRALQELGRLRPDSFYDRYDGNSVHVPVVVTGDADGTYDEVLLTDSFDADMMFYSAVLAYVVGSVELQDDEFTLEGRAVMLLGSFRAAVLGG